MAIDIYRYAFSIIVGAIGWVAYIRETWRRQRQRDMCTQLSDRKTAKLSEEILRRREAERRSQELVAELEAYVQSNVRLLHTVSTALANVEHAVEVIERYRKVKPTTERPASCDESQST